MKILPFLIACVVLLSCTQTQENKTVTEDLKKDVAKDQLNPSRELVPEPDIVDRLQYQKMIIDTAISKSGWTNEVWVTEPKSLSLTRVINEQWPETVETTYNIWRDEKNAIQLIGEYPFSESGDWEIAYLHYFDRSALTFAFARYTGFYNSLCTGDMAKEDIIDYYDAGFNRRDRSYKLKDLEGNKLEKDNCEFPYDHPYEVVPDLETYLSRINYPDR